ncbi:MAG TPA: hypothetical protein DCQ68_17125, partial [Chryseobacterium indologenes]|nr:hypothetical protein [Chryseobacterium indologenes]
ECTNKKAFVAKRNLNLGVPKTFVILLWFIKKFKQLCEFQSFTSKYGVFCIPNPIPGDPKDLAWKVLETT